MPTDGRNSGGKTAAAMTRTIADRLAHFATDPGNRLGKLTGTLNSGAKCAEISGLRGGAAFLAACLVRENLKTRLLYITACDKDCARARDAIGLFTGEIPPADCGEENGLSFLTRLKNAPVVCASVNSVSKRVVSPDFLNSSLLRLKTGDEIDRDELVRRLEQTGYLRKEFSRLAGEISVRGAIVDTVPAGADPPLRIEFSGDKIRSLRRFDPQTQLSVKQERSAQIPPARASCGDGAGACSHIVDHCGENPVVFFETGAAENIGEALKNSRSGKKDISDSSKYFSATDTERKISQLRTVLIRTLGTGETDFQTATVKPQAGGVVSSAGKIVSAAKSLKSGGLSLNVLLGSKAETEKMREIFAEEAIENARFYTGTAGGGFVFPDIGEAFIDERDFAEKISVAPEAKKTAGGTAKFSASVFESTFGNISEGDFIVHREFGIGIFRGLKNLTIKGAKGDFIECEYHGGDSIYVPVAKFNLLHRYSENSDGRPPKTDKLGAAAWRKTVQRAQKATEAVAKELLEMYANRKSCAGHSFSKPDPDFRKFEMDFMFEETPDQKKAIEDVMTDMESPRPMDRLICGDTGFGKTEVALRAALKAAMDGFQVAFIAPTTLLVSQHLKTARKRLEKFPVNVVALSRFNSAKEEKAVLAELKRGTADIVIGTHKLLGEKVKFKNIGLLIIDEEHKFGVRHKEKLKALRDNVDVLSLSATPIPRTLQLSLAGIRDISAIKSPPHGRLPVKIRMGNWDDKLIRKIILRETGRGGVFFVHNRIETIDFTARRLKKLVPEISMETTHGRMGKKEIEDKIEKFTNGRIDMLVTTAIVESGLDIARANTIIVNDAHTFGIADLYQLKGRVGRGKEQAYAHFLTPAGKSLTSTAQKRLERFSELWNFGSGYELAFSDLQIRGVGNLFGLEQSGHIAGVGVEFYLEMLRETIERLQTGKTQREIEPEIRTKTESRIPEDYVKSGAERLVFYKRISSSSTTGEVSALKEEIRDRFGPVPDRLNNLLVFTALKAFLKKQSVGLFEMEHDSATAYPAENSRAPMLFFKDGKNWKVRSCGGFPEKTAKKVTRLISSLKSV